MTQTAPVFAAIIAVLVLDEALAVAQWQAVVATVAGPILLSLGRDVEYRRLFLRRSFFLLIAASVIMAVSHVVSKVPLDTLSVPLVHGLRSLGIGAVLLGASISNRDARADMMQLIARRSAGLAIVSFSELILVNAYFLLFLWALSKGSVGLVTAVLATRSLFILIMSTLLSLRFRDILGEHVAPGTLVVKTVSVTLIVVGVGVITLG